MQSSFKPTVDLGYPTEAYGRIPAFNDIEEEAEFWDTHDLTQFDGVELQRVEVNISPDLRDRITVRLEPADREQLARAARSMGVGPSTLARIWLKERLARESERTDRDPERAAS